MTSKEVYITREIEEWIKVQTPHYPILSVMGPRRCGKTKLIRRKFPELPYFDLEKEATFKMISKNPDQFVRDHCMNGAVFDEFQYVPQLTEILKTVSDELLFEAEKEGATALSTRFVITGSHNYLFNEKIRETMTGRAAIINLLPFTIQETGAKDPFELMYKGGYPAIYTDHQSPKSFFSSYIQNYLDREVRNVHGIKDLLKFQEFMEICASLVGNFFDYETAGSTLGVSRKTLDEWLMVLYASFIIFFVRPYNKSIPKQMAKKHKIYFYDTGLAAALNARVKSPEHIKLNADLKGRLFENLIFSEIWKKNFIQGEYLPCAYFWNVTGENGYEVDMIMEGISQLKAIEIKSSDTFNPKWFDNMQKHPDLKTADKFVVYTGPTMDVEGGRALNFCDLDQLFLA